MPHTFVILLRWGLGGALAGVLAACATAPDDASEVLARATQAMGTAKLKTLRYVGSGTGYTFGQAYKPDAPWPKITLHSVTRTIDYESASMRDEVVLSRAEPRGGGGYPLSGQQRNDQYLSGEFAWNLNGTTVAPGPRFVNDRVHQLWITPHGALKAAARNDARFRRTDAGFAVTFLQRGRLAATILIGSDGLVSRVESIYPDPVLGDTRAVTDYSDYRDVDGFQVPMRVRQSIGGFPVLDLTLTEASANVATDFQVPEAARNVAERVTIEDVAEGVWFVAGGSHNSVAIELQDHLMLVEAPLNDARAAAVMATVRQLAPGKPIRYVVNSHAHFDHSGGVRAAAAEGATIVTQAANVPYFERVFEQANALQPDRMALARSRADLIPVKERMELGDSSRSVELLRLADSAHSDSMLIVYLPKERLLIEADAYTPAAPNSPAPSVANPYHLNLIANIERLRLSVDRILPLHGRVVPVSELYLAAGKTPAR